MKENCNCQYCKQKVNEKFCTTCGYSYNACESIYDFNPFTFGDLPVYGTPLCPNCVNDETKENIKEHYFSTHFKKISKDEKCQIQ